MYWLLHFPFLVFTFSPVWLVGCFALICYHCVKDQNQRSNCCGGSDWPVGDLGLSPQVTVSQNKTDALAQGSLSKETSQGKVSSLHLPYFPNPTLYTSLMHYLPVWFFCSLSPAVFFFFLLSCPHFLISIAHNCSIYLSSVTHK